MYGFEPDFWVKLFLLIAFMSAAGFSFTAIMRKWLKVEKPKRFSHNHVNDLHKRIDWSLRGVFVALMLIGYFVNISRAPQESILFLEVWFLLFALLIITETVRAVMERKYAKNPNAYIVTMSQLAFWGVLVSSIFMTDFYGIFQP